MIATLGLVLNFLMIATLIICQLPFLVAGFAWSVIVLSFKIGAALGARVVSSVIHKS